METMKEWLGILLEPLAVIVAVAITLWWGHKYWRKQKNEEGLFLQKQKLYEAKLEAVKAVWGLIIFFSENDNDKNMFLRGGKNGQGEKEIYFRADQAKQFFDQLNIVFFEQGHGAFLEKEIKSLIFELRSQAYAWYHIASKSPERKIVIANAQKYDRIVEIREQLIKTLRELLLVH